MYEFLDRRYALALYERCVEEGNVELVLQQFKEIVDEMDSNRYLMEVLKNPQINKFDKKRIFTELFKECIEDELLKFLLLTIDKERILFLREKYVQFNQIYLDDSKILIAEIVSTIYLSNEEKNTLKRNLEERYKKTIIFKEKVDKSLIGGIVIRIGDEIIDGSIKNRIVEFKKVTNEINESNDVRRLESKDIMLGSLEHKCSKNLNNGLHNPCDREALRANVTTARPLRDDEKVCLINSLESFYNRNIVIDESIDKDIIGGVLIKVGNDITDYTLREKLKHIKRETREVEFKKISDEISRNNDVKQLLAKGIMSDPLEDNCNKNLSNSLQSSHDKEAIHASVTTARPLREDEKVNLISSLEKFYNGSIVIDESVDKDIIGGVLIKVGDDITDYTVREKLKYIKKDRLKLNMK